MQRFMMSRTRLLAGAAALLVLLGGLLAGPVAGFAADTTRYDAFDDDEDAAGTSGEYTTQFNLKHCSWSTTGRNLFMSLVPGTRHILEGEEDGDTIRTEATVLAQTEKIGRVTTRVLEERHFINDELDEVSYNYYALCRETGGIFYFGETVDYYEDGQIVGHEGAWRAGVDGAEPGLYMPGQPLLGARYYQEIAPGAALDRAEIISLDASVGVPAGSWRGCLETRETTPLEPGAEEPKVFCPEVGIAVDGAQELISYTNAAPGRRPGR